MPKYGIHHVVLSDAITRLRDDPSLPAQDAATVLDQNKNAAMIGAIGPDLLFFAPDYEDFNKLYRLYKNIKDAIDQYNRITQPITEIHEAVTRDIPIDTVVGTVSPSTERLIRLALQKIDETSNLFKSALSTSLFVGVTIEALDMVANTASLPGVSATFFKEVFTPPLQNNEPVRRWYWFDMLHYRNTGDFARNLVLSARTPRQRAYAYGYLSHIATDLVGHAFVNQIVGGPYRMHVQRHVTVENFMDCRIFDERYHESINSMLLDRLGLPETLPREIGDLIYQSLLDTFRNVEHPRRINIDDGTTTHPTERGFLKREQIDETYEIFYEVLQIMKDMSIRRPEEPFSDVLDILGDALRNITSRPPPSAPSFGGGTCSLEDILSIGLTARSRECYENFFNDLGRFFEYLGELFDWAFDTLRRIIEFLQTALESLAISVLLALLYGLQLILYEIYQTARSALALTGFIFPEPTDLNTSHGRNLTTTFQCMLDPYNYPKQAALNVSHLSCPPPNVENPRTRSDFNPSSDTTTANVFITTLPFDVKNLRRYASSPSPEDTRKLHSEGVTIGNARDLTAWMITTSNNASATEELKSIAFANWNLDSDRGYGYKTWAGLIPDDLNGNIITRSPETGLRIEEDQWSATSPIPPLEEQLTDFRARVHGFHFPNKFVNNVIFDIKTKGRCGGMAYASLDYYFAGRQIPDLRPEHFQPNTYPPDGHPIADYIYRRLFDSFTAPRAVNYPRWTLASNVDVSRWTKKDEFFRLQYYIDNGMPVPLGLIKATNLIEIGNENHQIVAYGYLFDRDAEMMKVYVYDNNFPDKEVVLISDPSQLAFEEMVPDENGTLQREETYRGFFVHNYRRANPP